MKFSHIFFSCHWINISKLDIDPFSPTNTFTPLKLERELCDLGKRSAPYSSLPFSFLLHQSLPMVNIKKWVWWMEEVHILNSRTKPLYWKCIHLSSEWVSSFVSIIALLCYSQIFPIGLPFTNCSSCQNIYALFNLPIFLHMYSPILCILGNYHKGFPNQSTIWIHSLTYREMMAKFFRMVSQMRWPFQ